MMTMRAKVGLALLLAMTWTIGSAALAQESREAATKPTALDLFGDPLPSRAIARVKRFRRLTAV